MIIVSVILAAIAAAAVGGAMALADKLGFYLIIVFPIIGGTIIGFAAALPFLGRKSASAQPSNLGGGLADVVVRDNRPSALPLIVVAILGALIATAVYWAGQYLTYKEELVSIIQEEQTTVTRDEALEFISMFEQETYGTTGFPAFVQLYAEEGMSINRVTSSSDSGLLLQGGLAYAFWGVEFVMIAGFAIGAALRNARGKAAPQVATAS